MVRKDGTVLTGVFIRCKVDGTWGSHDISEAPIEAVVEWTEAVGRNFLVSIVMTMIGRGKEYDKLMKIRERFRDQAQTS